MAFPAPSPAVRSDQPTSIPRLQGRHGIRTLPVGIQLADHHIRRVTDDRTANTRDITTQETHPGLLQRIVALLWLPQRSIDVINSRLERCEFHHRIRNLPPPKRIETLVQTPDTFLRRDLAPPFAQGTRERRDRRLHAHFDGLERAQGEIGEELGRRRRREVDDRFVGVGEHLVPVRVLEHLVEAVLAGPLEAVPHGRRRPAEEDAAQALGAVDGAPGVEVGRVDFRVHLAPAFD